MHRHEFGDSIALVCATHNREGGLRATLQNKLAIEGVSRLVFVLDGCTDSSRSVLEAARLLDRRIEILEIPKSGVQAARNTGITRVIEDWILLIDDDDFVPADFAVTLLRTSQSVGAAAAGAPWLFCEGVDPSVVAEEARADAVDSIALRSPVGTFTREPVETPFFSSACLIRTDAALRFPFQSSYRGNGWREETDVFMQIAEAELGVIRTSEVFAWSEGRYSGGHRRSLFRYEMWVFINDALFHYRHRKYLSSTESRWRGWVTEWLRAYVAREASIARAGMGALWRRRFRGL